MGKGGENLPLSLLTPPQNAAGRGAQFFHGGPRHPHSVNRGFSTGGRGALSKISPPPPPPPTCLFWLELVLAPTPPPKRFTELCWGDDLPCERVSTMLQRGRRLEPEALKFRV